jgi:hypothetical protein
MKKETQNLEAIDLSKKGTVIDNILAKKLVGGGTGADAGVIAPCVHQVTPPPPPKFTPGG